MISLTWRELLALTKKPRRVHLRTMPPREWVIGAMKRHGLTAAAKWVEECDGFLPDKVRLRRDVAKEMVAAEWPDIRFTY